MLSVSHHGVQKETRCALCAEGRVSSQGIVQAEDSHPWGASRTLQPSGREARRGVAATDREKQKAGGFRRVTIRETTVGKRQVRGTAELPGQSPERGNQS